MTTRDASKLQEEYIANKFNGKRTPNSGATAFKKGDVILECGMLVECKTCMKEKESFSIKKEWVTKNKSEAFQNRNTNSCICFNFGPNQPNYFVIDEKLMQFLCKQLMEDNNETF